MIGVEVINKTTETNFLRFGTQKSFFPISEKFLYVFNQNLVPKSGSTEAMYNSYIKRPVQVRSPYHLTSVQSVNAFAFTMENPQQSAGAFFCYKSVLGGRVLLVY